MLRKLTILILGLILLTGCSRVAEVKRSGFYLDNVFETKIKFRKDKHAVKRVENLVNNAYSNLVQLDNNLNKLSTISELYALNSLSGIKNVEVSSETYNLIKKAITGSLLTDGYFDITWEPLVQIFNRSTPPSPAEINRARNSIGYLNVQLDKNFNRIRFSNTTVKINLDQIKKGYALDLMAQDIIKKDFNSGYLRTKNVAYYIGRKTEKFNLAEKKDIKFNVSNRAYAIVTNNDPFLKNAEQWKYYLPVEVSENAIEKIIVVAPNAVTAEVLANAFYFMGPDKSIALIKTLKSKVSDASLYNVVLVSKVNGETKIISSLH